VIHPTSHAAVWTRSLLALALALGGCLQNHDPAATAVGGPSACYGCHQLEYDGTVALSMASKAAPNHHALGMPTTCGDCHTTSAWVLATNHTESVFSIKSGPHANIDCKTCHNVGLKDATGGAVGSSIKGANADCTNQTCHPATNQLNLAHAGTAFPSNSLHYTARTWGTDFTYVANEPDHRFCLECHPSGTGGKHNEQIFSSQHGRANGVCATCHQPSLGSNGGGKNAPCVNSGCHASFRVGSPHKEGPVLQDLGWHSCWSCHN
jgi:hypothetical protein